MRARPNHIAEKRYGPLVFKSGSIDEDRQPVPHMVIRHPRRKVTVAISEGVLSDLLMPHASITRTKEAYQRLYSYAEALFGIVTKADFRKLVDSILDYYPECINVRPHIEGKDALLKRMERDRVQIRANGELIEFY